MAVIDPAPAEEISSPADRSVVDETEARCRALAAVCGNDAITAKPGKTFSCVLPGHDDPHKARLRRCDEGYWRYQCLQPGRRLELLDLPGVRASFAHGHIVPAFPKPKVSEKGSPIGARWQERLDFEADLLTDARELSVDHLPRCCPDHARKLYEGMARFVGLRDALWPFTEPFVFARGFAKAYCGLTERGVRDGLRWLHTNGFVFSAPGTVDSGPGRTPAKLWRLDAQQEALEGGSS